MKHKSYQDYLKQRPDQAEQGLNNFKGINPKEVKKLKGSKLPFNSRYAKMDT